MKISKSELMEIIGEEIKKILSEEEVDHIFNRRPIGGRPGGKRKPKRRGHKPDFLDLDKDGDKEEPMKDAAKDAEELEESGKCTGPTKKASSTSKGKKWMQCVKNPDGKGYKRIHWGQKGVRVTGDSGDTKRKKSFRARHGCKDAKPGTAKYMACKDWQFGMKIIIEKRKKINRSDAEKRDTGDLETSINNTQSEEDKGTSQALSESESDSVEEQTEPYQKMAKKRFEKMMRIAIKGKNKYKDTGMKNIVPKVGKSGPPGE